MIPESPRWYLRKGQAQTAVNTVNRIIARAGDKVLPLSVSDLGDNLEAASEKLPPYWALFAPGQAQPKKFTEYKYGIQIPSSK